MFTLARPAATPRISLLRRFFVALALRRQRHSLLALDAHMLRDIGLTRDQARAEAALPFWPAPEHWLAHQR